MVTAVLSAVQRVPFKPAYLYLWACQCGPKLQCLTPAQEEEVRLLRRLRSRWTRSRTREWGRGWERGQAGRALQSDVQAVPRQNPQRYVLQEAYQVGQEPLCSSPLTMAIYVMMPVSTGLFFRREQGQAIRVLRSDVQAVPRQNPQRYVLQEAYQVGQEPLCPSTLTMTIYVMRAVSTGLSFRRERGQAIRALRSDVQAVPRQNPQR